MCYHAQQTAINALAKELSCLTTTLPFVDALPHNTAPGLSLASLHDVLQIHILLMPTLLLEEVSKTTSNK